ncbi:MAG: hypothetical protein Q8S75_13085 [Nitrospirota bacterium]|nr:hypothetical protein [Nitrospirota bacterium]
MKALFGVVVGLLLGMALVIGAQHVRGTDVPLLSIDVSEAATSESLGGHGRGAACPSQAV